MTLAVRVVSEIAATIGLVPLGWLGGRRLWGHRTDASYWWLALAFAVSWLADFAALWVDPWRVSILYPLTQAGLIGVVFLTRAEATGFLGVLAVAAVVAVAWDRRPDLLLHSAAWLGVVVVVWRLRQIARLRAALLVYFGVGWLCWVGYSIWPGWWSWSALQLSRAVGLALFCVAATERGPVLRLS